MNSSLFPGEFFRVLERMARRPSGRGGLKIVPRAGNQVQGFEPRPARVGDDSRRVDWRASARTGNLQVRRREGGRGGRLVLALDRSPSLAPGNSRRDFDQRRLALALGWMTLEGGGEVVLCQGGAPARKFGSFARRAALQAALEGMESSLEEGGGRLSLPAPGNSRLVALGDPWAEDPWWDSLGAWASRGGRAEAVCMVLPQEDLPPSGPLRLADVESGEQILAHPRGNSWPLPWDAWLESWRGRALDRGLSPVLLRVGGDSEPASRILELAGRTSLV